MVNHDRRKIINRFDEGRFYHQEGFFSSVGLPTPSEYEFGEHFVDMFKLREHDLHNNQGTHPENYLAIKGTNEGDDIFDHPDFGFCSYQESSYQKGAYKHGRLNQINSDYFLGPDFVQNPTYMAIGCSQTHVNGMPWNLSWPHLVAKHDSATINAAGFPGQSITYITEQALAIIAKYGAPEVLMFLVPDLLRASLPNGLPTGVYDYVHREYVYGDENGEPIPLTIQSRIDKSRKKPYDIPIDLIAHYNLSVLDNFALACEALDIELRMYSWEPNTNYAMHSMRNRNWMVTAPHACVDHHGSVAVAKENDKWDTDRGTFKDLRAIGKAPDNHAELIGSALPKEAILWHTDICTCGYKPPPNAWVSAYWTWADDMPDNQSRMPHHGVHSQIHLAETFSGEQFGQAFIEELGPFWMADGLTAPVEYLKEFE